MSGWAVNTWSRFARQRVSEASHYYPPWGSYIGSGSGSGSVGSRFGLPEGAMRVWGPQTRVHKVASTESYKRLSVTSSFSGPKNAARI